MPSVLAGQLLKTTVTKGPTPLATLNLRVPPTAIFQPCPRKGSWATISHGRHLPWEKQGNSPTLHCGPVACSQLHKYFFKPILCTKFMTATFYVTFLSLPGPILPYSELLLELHMTLYTKQSSVSVSLNGSVKTRSWEPLPVWPLGATLPPSPSSLTNPCLHVPKLLTAANTYRVLAMCQSLLQALCALPHLILMKNLMKT